MNTMKVQVTSKSDKQERGFFIPLGLYEVACGMDRVSPQNDQLISQTFASFRWIYLPTNPFFTQARLTDLFGPAPSPASTLTSMAHVTAFPWSHPQAGTRGEGRVYHVPSIRTSPLLPSQETPQAQIDHPLVTERGLYCLYVSLVRRNQGKLPYLFFLPPKEQQLL